ncbi:MAG: 1-deoxy-D-xylulose-5-phosphate synthase [Acidobacteria bacterium]|nr:1-deoxy-D-xylulose-5-phosphate synthase [Acidobacteriota bacterium]
MRKAFIAALVELAEQDPRIVFLTGDLGYLAVEPFAERFPKRFYNVGVAEQNMMGLATGLAEGGMIPFVYSIAPFAILRPYEFFRNGPVQHRLPVRVVGVGGGFEYGPNGFSHYALEDIALMRAQPGVTVVVPADHVQAGNALRVTAGLPGPVYFRLGKDDKTTVPDLNGRFYLGRAQLVVPGDDLLFVALGTAVQQAVAAANVLETHGIDAAIALVDNLTDAHPENLTGLLARYGCVITVEAHYLNGGVGSLVCEIVATEGLDCRVVRCGVARLESGVSGSEAYMLDQHGLSASKLVEKALSVVGST